jgi:hypothetical protein
MRIKELLLENTAKTLYHGTLRKYINNIQQVGLVPSVGQFTLDAYGHTAEDEHGFANLVFAADKDGLDNCHSAIGSWIRLVYPTQTRPYGPSAIFLYGALCVIKEGGGFFDRMDPDEGDSPEWAGQVERGDYYTDRRVKVDYIIMGKKLIQLFNQYDIFYDYANEKNTIQQNIKKSKKRNHITSSPVDYIIRY